LTNPTISQGELHELKSKDPLKAFKFMWNNITASTKENQRTSIPSVSDSSENSKENLLQEHRQEVFDIDLFKSIEKESPVTFGIKTLLHKLNKSANS